MLTNTGEKTTEVNPNSFFEPLPYGDYTPMGIYTLKCEACGELYYERTYIGPDKFMYTDKTACACERKKIEQRDFERCLKEARQKVQGECDYYFKKYDMLQDPELSDRVLSRFDVREHPSRLEAFNALSRFKIGQDSICLFGPPGRGKSFLAIAYAREQKIKGYSVLCIKCPQILDRIKLVYSLKDEADERNIIRICQSLDLLVIDEIGIENATPWAIEKLYAIIDYRHDHNKSSIYTTNLTGLEIKEREGPALRSRILGAGGPGSKYLVDGRDRRVA